MSRAEISHALIGIGLMLMAVLALYAWRKPTSRARFVWPALLIIVGINLFVPAEDPVDLDHPVGWLETVGDLYPVDPGQWVASFGTMFVFLHKTIALMAMLVGGLELARATGHLSSESRWSHVLPVASVIAGILLVVHRIDVSHAAHDLAQLHHTVVAACFIVGGLLLGLFRSGRVETTVYRDAWPILVFSAGVDFALLFHLG